MKEHFLPQKNTGVCHHRSKDPLLLTACCLAAGAVVNQQYTRRRHYLSPHTHYLSSLRCLPRTELATRLVHMSAPHLICCSLPQQIQLTTHMYIKVHTHRTELVTVLATWPERAWDTHTFSSPTPRAAAAWAPGSHRVCYPSTIWYPEREGQRRSAHISFILPATIYEAKTFQTSSITTGRSLITTR